MKHTSILFFPVIKQSTSVVSRFFTELCSTASCTNMYQEQAHLQVDMHMKVASNNDQLIKSIQKEKQHKKIQPVIIKHNHIFVNAPS
jgi:hypothetical protein